MGRDPAETSSELGGLSLTPSDVRQAPITIIHPQLRDLVLPLARGHVLYPRGSALEEQWWAPSDSDADDDEVVEPTLPAPSTTRTFARLTFTPNCVTARNGVIACGGQNGQLYLAHLPSSPWLSPTARLKARFHPAPPSSPFTVNTTLATRSINNSITILPCYPDEWHRIQVARRTGFIGQQHNPSELAVEHVTVGDSRDPDVDDDVLMDLESDTEDMDDAPSPTLSYATYPNSLEFPHGSRLARRSLSASRPEAPVTSRRTGSFAAAHQDSRMRQRPANEPLSSPDQAPPIQYVTSLPQRAATLKAQRESRRLNEPRILISNNDRTVKMFALRRTSQPGPEPGSESPTEAARREEEQEANLLNGMSEINTLDYRRRRRELIEGTVTYESRAPPPLPSFGSSFGFDSIGANEGIRANEEAQSVVNRMHGHALERELERASAVVRRQNEELERRWSDMEREAGRIPPDRQGSRSPTGSEQKDSERRGLAKIGGSRFKCPVNHSSLSPDLSTMVSVGDSPKVYLFHVIDGGRDFKKIGVYTGANDSAFSTAWSKDGRKFAVASKDGQVTVWDHRSSKPLAIFHSSMAVNNTRSSTSDPSAAVEAGADNQVNTEAPSRFQYLNPITREPASDVNASGKEPAWVVKFSPEGSSRDLLVFTEENTHMHIIDAKTFNTHVLVPVPYVVPSSTVDPTSLYSRRQGVEMGKTGIAGVAFEPEGNFLYAGTENTVVEWDLRRVYGGGGGTWDMA